MKKIIVFTLVIFLGGFVTIGFLNTEPTSEYLRIHIRANSNLETDQSIKYLVKDAVVKVMIPILAECETKKEAEIVISNNFDLIEQTANNVLFSNGFSYTSSARLATEEFPTRDYDNLVLEKGFYDALILDLGEGSGNNWWCVVYPPLCFLNSNATGEGIVYRSKLIEIIKSILG
ncbi:MAG: stage II sporulation protein R [Clostridia bacterium]|nr:stage II sporulation protein R [Clostridia bacterium]